jgi:hypothetical protein
MKRNEKLMKQNNAKSFYFALKQKLDAKRGQKCVFYFVWPKWLMKQNKEKNNGNFISLVLVAKKVARIEKNRSAYFN